MQYPGDPQASRIHAGTVTDIVMSEYTRHGGLISENNATISTTTLTKIFFSSKWTPNHSQASQI